MITNSVETVRGACGFVSDARRPTSASQVVRDVDRERRDQQAAGDQRAVEDPARQVVEGAELTEVDLPPLRVGRGDHRGERADHDERHQQRRHALRRHPRHRQVDDVGREAEGHGHQHDGPERDDRQADEAQPEQAEAGVRREEGERGVHDHDRDRVDRELPRRQRSPPLLAGVVPRAPVAGARRGGGDDPRADRGAAGRTHRWCRRAAGPGR